MPGGRDLPRTLPCRHEGSPPWSRRPPGPLCSCGSCQTSVSRPGALQAAHLGLSQLGEHREEDGNGLGASGQEGVPGMCLLWGCICNGSAAAPHSLNTDGGGNAKTRAQSCGLSTASSLTGGRTQHLVTHLGAGELICIQDGIFLHVYLENVRAQGQRLVVSAHQPSLPAHHHQLVYRITGLCLVLDSLLRVAAATEIDTALPSCGFLAPRHKARSPNGLLATTPHRSYPVS